MIKWKEEFRKRFTQAYWTTTGEKVDDKMMNDGDWVLWLKEMESDELENWIENNFTEKKK